MARAVSVWCGVVMTFRISQQRPSPDGVKPNAAAWNRAG